MEINLDRSALRSSEVPIDDLIPLIASGKALLFTGAGFSIGSVNMLDTSLPTAKELAKEICKLGEFEEDEDLRYAADYYLQYKDKNNLINLLKETFSLKTISEDHVTICKANWRRFYTTNYDDSIEIASRASSKLVETINLEDSPKKHYRKKGICLHLNGSISSLDEDSLEKDFKLSTSSYISPDSFLTSHWYFTFKQDLERCSAIVFVGYSLYDIEIQKILFENKSFKDKTFFITRTNPDPKSKFTMEKFGHVLPIGSAGFAKLLNDHPQTFNSEASELSLESLVKYEITDAAEKIVRDADIETMLMYGKIDQSNIDLAVLGEQKAPYLIIRDALKQILSFIQDGQETIVFSEFGNGKSVILNELLPYLSVNAFDVYTLEDKGGDYIGDLEKLSKSASRIVIIIDGYEPYLDLIQHFTLLAASNIRLVLTARSTDHDKLKRNLREIGFKFNELNIDLLSSNEVDFFVRILDHIGLWGEAASLSPERKVDSLKQDNQLQISLAMLSIFKSPQIISRVNEVISGLFEVQEHKDTIFAIAVLEILGLDVNSSIISEVAMNKSIYGNELREKSAFKQLFRILGNKIVTKSSLFCLSLVNNHFEASYIIQQMQKISKKFSTQFKDSWVEDKVFKSTLRFSFIETLLPDQNKKSNLYRYYEELKTSVEWLNKDPHYWLQYGMARLPYKDYDKAQSYFDQAYGLAKNKYQYYTNNIDTQQGRLYILRALDIADPTESFNRFIEGHKLLSRLDDDVYKFRQVSNYREYFDIKYKHLSKANRNSFKSYCTQMLTSLQNSVSKGAVNLSHQKTFARVEEHLTYVLSKAS